jgi:hypothetical protein
MAEKIKKKNYMEKNGVLAEIQSEYLQNKSPEHNSYANPLEVTAVI